MEIKMESTESMDQLLIEPLEHQKKAFEWMKSAELTEKGGGILADDMGLGKTVDAIWLMISDSSVCVSKKLHFQLVIAPFGLIDPWNSEINSCTELVKENRCFIYHGKSRREKLYDFFHYCKEKKVMGIVLSTYEIVRRDYNEKLIQSTRNKNKKEKIEKKNRNHQECIENNKSSDDENNSTENENNEKEIKNGKNNQCGDNDLTKDDSNEKNLQFTKENCDIFSIEWYRVMLDEAHRIRNENSALFKSLCFLKSKKKWAISGTPIQNNWRDLQSLAKFIDIEPYNREEWWKKAMKDEKTFLKWKQIYFFKRDKGSLLSLPKKTIIEEKIELSNQEKLIQDILMKKAMSNYQNVSKSTGEKKRKMGDLLSFLIKLRQSCNHPILLAGKDWDKNGNWKQKESCVSCITSKSNIFSKKKKMKISPCGHLMCNNCIKSNEDCFICDILSEWIQIKGKKTLLLPGDKINHLLSSCKDILSKQKNKRIVLFSQWTSTLDLLDYFYSLEKYKTFRYDGNIPSSEERASILDQFRECSEHCVLLCSIQAAGVGLNLTCSNLVVIFDRTYNPSLEEQAIDRIYRIGQKEDVTVLKFKVMNSIEEEIELLHKKKSTMIDLLVRRKKRYSEPENHFSFKYSTFPKELNLFDQKTVFSLFNKLKKPKKRKYIDLIQLDERESFYSSPQSLKRENSNLYCFIGKEENTHNTTDSEMDSLGGDNDNNDNRAKKDNKANTDDNSDDCSDRDDCTSDSEMEDDDDDDGDDSGKEENKESDSDETYYLYEPKKRKLPLLRFSVSPSGKFKTFSK